ncbi:MAG: PAS domain S-box protein, partial [Eubacteriales bacterium]
MGDGKDSSEQAGMQAFMAGAMRGVICDSGNCADTEDFEQKQRDNLKMNVLTGVHDAVFAISQDFTLCYWNSIAEKISGFAAHDVLGRSAAELLKLMRVENDDVKHIRKCLMEYGVFTGVVKAYCKDGSAIWGDAHVKYSPGQEGGFCDTVVTFRDITQRKLAEEKMAFQANLLSAANEAITATDEQFSITYWNPAAEKLSGWTGEEALGERISQLMQIEVPGLNLSDELAELFSEGVWSGEATIQRRDGTRVWTESRTRILRNEAGSFCGIIISSRDITKRKLNQAKINRQKIVLEAINRVYSEYVSCDTIEHLGKVCLQIAEGITGSSVSFVGEMGEDGRFLNIAMSDLGSGQYETDCNTVHTKLPGNFAERSLYGSVLKNGKTLLINEPHPHSKSAGLPEGHPELQSFLGIPFLQGGCVKGMLAVANRPGGYTEEEREILEAITPTIMSVILRKRAEIAKQESENLYRSLFENTEDAFAVIRPIYNENGKVIDFLNVEVSKNHQKHTGMPASAVAGKTAL